MTIQTIRKFYELQFIHKVTFSLNDESLKTLKFKMNNTEEWSSIKLQQFFNWRV